MKPINDLILVKLLEEKREVAGLILTSSQDTYKKAFVLAIPDNEKDIPLGCTVLIKNDVGHTVDDKLLVRKADVLGIFE